MMRVDAMDAANGLARAVRQHGTQGRLTGRGEIRRQTQGFTYLGVLLLVALMGSALTVTSQVWNTVQQRDREEELLFVGGQIRNALALYAANTPGNGERFPQRLDDLLKDPRYPGVRRYLRKLYRDPVTGRVEWGLVKTPTGAIVGVFSQSDRVPLKISQFSLADQGFEGKTKYSEWVFMPRSSPGAAVMAPPGAPVGQIQSNVKK
jgi:type II secretory pathway pseudopilin PulG